MTVYILPDTESMVVAYLKAQPDVLALIPATNIATELTAGSTFPFLQITLITTQVPVERYLAGAAIQIDAWGGTRLEARALCQTAHAALIEMIGIQGVLGTVTGVGTITGPRKLIDSINNRARYQSEVRVWTHK